MAQRIKYPVGIQTFSEIINEGYFYVDKTEILHQLATDEKYVFLSRPRRFGKSLLISTLEAYFKGEKDLFEGLAISHLETKWEKYPVFRFDLSGENYNDPQKMVDHIEGLLDDIEFEYDFKTEGSISGRFRRLISQAFRSFGKKVVILIDEYDKPLLDCLHDNKLHERLRADVLNAFKSNRLKHYWFTSGSSSYLVKLVQRHGFILSDLDGVRRKESALSDISDIAGDFVPLLYQAGYLTIKDYNSATKEYTLGFPNREVYEGFWDSLARYLFRGYGNSSTFDLQKFVADVNEGRPEAFMTRLQSLFADTETGHESRLPC